MALQLSFMKLPNEAQVLALRMFNDIELIAFSLLSNRAFIFAKSLNRKNEIEVTTYRNFTVSFGRNPTTNLTFYDNGSPQPAEIQILDIVKIEIVNWNSYKDLVWKNMKMELKAGIRHIMELFHQPQFYNIIISSGSRFRLDIIYSLFADFQVRELSFHCDLTTNTRIQAPSLLAPSHSLEFDGGNPLRDALETQKMLLQNVPTLKFVDSQNLQLNDLLSCNCKEVLGFRAHIPIKEMRKWFKLWQAGANKRLESMYFTFYTTNQEFDWFVGNLTQSKNTTSDICMDYVYKGANMRNGCKIWRKDRRAMAHVLVTRESGGDQFLCLIRMKVLN